MSKHRRSALERGSSYYSFQIVGIIYIASFAIACLIPFIMIITGSLTSETEIYQSGYRLIPKALSLNAYQTLLKRPETIIRAYGVTTFVTATHTIISLFLTALTGFVLSRQDFKARNGVSFFIYFSMLFGPSLLVSYILIVRYLQWKNNLLALIVPGMLSPYYIILMKNFVRVSIPHELFESAKIEGAGVFRTFLAIVLPLSKPVLATIGLFTALGMWNSWFSTMLYIEKPDLYMLQYYLYKSISNLQFLKNNVKLAGHVAASIDLPEQSLKLATALVVTGPIILLYPFLQKFFIKGLTIGAVKG